MSDRREGMDPTAIARARGELAAASGRRRLDVILDQKDPAALVRALPGDELYFTIREIGLGDAVDLVHLATPAQFRTFLDLACWSGEHFEPRKALPWLRAARVGSLDSPRAAARWRAKLAALDVEVLHLAFRETLDIHDLEEDPDPVLGDRFMRTPEGKYVIGFRAEGTEYVAIRGIIDDLYAEDPFRATRLLISIRSDLPSELEESALRWRTARLADLGYPSLDEALSWFARPAVRAAPPAGIPARPPGFWLERLGTTGSLLARAARRLDAEARDHLELELVTAANAVLVADRIDPGDVEAVRSAVATGRAFVEMGLEQVAGADEAAAAEALATTAVKSLFQRGFGRVLALKWRAERLFASGAAGTREAPLLDAPLGEMLAALARRRPFYFPGIELPREEWGSLAAGAFEPRGFLSSAEVARTADALEVSEQLVALAGALGLAPTTSAEAKGRDGATGRPPPRLATLYLTALANERLGRAFSPAPLDAEELGAAAAALAQLDDPRLKEHGAAGSLLAEMAGHLAQELAPLRAGARVRPEHVAAVLVR